MTSRERIRAALNHQEPDKIPIDLAGYFASGMAAIAYRKLRVYLDLEERPIRVYDPNQVLAIIDEDVMQRFGIDTVQAGRSFAAHASEIAGARHTQSKRSLWKTRTRPCQMSASAARSGARPPIIAINARATPPCETTI